MAAACVRTSLLTLPHKCFVRDHTAASLCQRPVKEDRSLLLSPVLSIHARGGQDHRLQLGTKDPALLYYTQQQQAVTDIS